jgi:hypothetical protein
LQTQGVLCNIPLFKYHNVVALSFKANEFEVREMGVLMLQIDLKGCKLCGRALLSFGLIGILSAPRDLKR